MIYALTLSKDVNICHVTHAPKITFQNMLPV